MSYSSGSGSHTCRGHALNGVVFFVDSLIEQTSTAADHPALDQSGVVERRLNDGRTFQVVKVFHEPATLECQLRERGWDGWCVRVADSFCTARSHVIVRMRNPWSRSKALAFILGSVSIPQPTVADIPARERKATLGPLYADLVSFPRGRRPIARAASATGRCGRRGGSECSTPPPPPSSVPSRPQRA
jgi:hypothetical protein